MRAIAIALIVVSAGTGARHVVKAPPPGTAAGFEPAPVTRAEFLSDITWTDEAGKRHVEQEIFDAALRLIADAPSYVLADQFLFNAMQGASPETTRPLADELTDALIARHAAQPPATVALITDPINTVYGGRRSPQLDRLRAAGVIVVETDLAALRDSNPLWSGPWRLLVAPWGRPAADARGWLPNPFSSEDGRVPLRSWLSMLNFKANHRKTLVVDTPDEPGTLTAVVSSANPHDGSSAHGNVALQVTGPVARAVAESERAVAAFSGVPIPAPPPANEGRSANRSADDPSVRVGMVSESRIRDALLAHLSTADEETAVDVAMFYLSDRLVVAALRDAADRGAHLRLLLDPNKDAFGRTKNGIPNRQVAWELREHATVRWCDTHGEQCHAKLVLIRPLEGQGDATLLIGSANLTRRNLGDLNLETDLLVEGPSDAPVLHDARAWFEGRWANEPGRVFSVGYDTWADPTLWKRILYRVMEATGLSTF